MATIEQLASEKEKELIDLRQRADFITQEKIKALSNELAQERGHMVRLQGDFNYNISLLNQRDNDLSKYEQAFHQVKRVVTSLVAENSHLKAQYSSLAAELSQCRKGQQEIKKHYVMKIEDMQVRMQTVRRVQQTELDCERDKLRKQQTLLENKLTTIEGEFHDQREQVSSSFEHILREREREYEQRQSELQSVLTSCETNVRKTGQELQLCQANCLYIERDASEKADERMRIEKECKSQLCSLEDQKCVQESQIKELEKKLSQSQSSFSRQLDEFQKKHADLDRRVREKETHLKYLKEAHDMKVSSLEGQIRELVSQLESKESYMKRAMWQHDDDLKEKEQKCQSCLEMADSRQREANERVETMMSELVTKDLQLESKIDEIDKWRERAHAASKELDKCQNELAVKTQTCKESITTIQKLSSDKDKLFVECGQLKMKFSQADHMNESVGHMTTTQSQVISQLQKQNAELHLVIRQMRTELETLAEPTNQNAQSSGYVQYIEKELKDLKKANRDLEEREQGARKPPHPQSPSGDGKHRSHVIALSDTIASLQRDKYSLQVELSQQRTRVEAIVRDYKEKIYSLKSFHIPPNKLHGKLVQATRVIISLVREKEALTSQIRGQRSSLMVHKHTQTGPLSQATTPRSVLISNQAGDFPSIDPLQFTEESSMGEESLDEVLKLARLTVESDSPLHTSTPEARLTQHTPTEPGPTQHTHTEPGPIQHTRTEPGPIQHTHTEPGPTQHTPEPGDDDQGPPNDEKLELVGLKISTMQRPMAKPKGQSRQRTVFSRKPRIRNYNIKTD